MLILGVKHKPLPHGDSETSAATDVWPYRGISYPGNHRVAAVTNKDKYKNARHKKSEKWQKKNNYIREAIYVQCKIVEKIINKICAKQKVENK